MRTARRDLRRGGGAERPSRSPRPPARRHRAGAAAAGARVLAALRETGRRSLRGPCESLAGAARAASWRRGPGPYVPGLRGAPADGFRPPRGFEAAAGKGWPGRRRRLLLRRAPAPRAQRCGISSRTAAAAAPAAPLTTPLSPPQPIGRRRPAPPSRPSYLSAAAPHAAPLRRRRASARRHPARPGPAPPADPPGSGAGAGAGADAVPPACRVRCGAVRLHRASSTRGSAQNPSLPGGCRGRCGDNRLPRLSETSELVWHRLQSYSNSERGKKMALNRV